MAVPKRNMWRAFPILLAFLAALLSLTTIAPDPSAPNTGLREIDTGWYRLEHGQQVPVELPGLVTLDTGEDLVLYNDTLLESDMGMTLATRGALYRLQIFLGDMAIYRYEDSAFPRNAQMRSKLDCNTVLPSQSGSHTLRLVYENPGDGQFLLEPVYVGLSGAIFRQQAAADIPTVLIVFTMALFSVLAISAAFYLWQIGMDPRQFAYMSGFLLLCGAWCALDSSLAQQLSDMSPAVCYLSFYAFMALGIPMLQFVRSTGNIRRFRSLDVCIVLFYANIIIQSILDDLGLFVFIDMLAVTHFLLLGGSTLITVLLVQEYRATRNHEILVILRAFALLLAGGVLALLSYWLFEFPHYGLIFEGGILVFIAYLLRSLTVSMVNNLRFKAEALIYKRLSREDQLTGLSNRRSFDDFLEDLESGVISCGDVALIFLDLNGLKYANDHFGHNAGDELIIAAARCIEEAFASQGTCYRIGGDEFAVILPDPVGDVDSWNAQLDQAIARRNQNNQYPLSIARGTSLLRNGERTHKAISDWKFEADQAMYRCKEQQKRV